MEDLPPVQACSAALAAAGGLAEGPLCRGSTQWLGVSNVALIVAPASALV